MKTVTPLAAALLVACAAPALAQDDEQPPPPLPAHSSVQSSAGTLQLEVVARGFEHPWALALLPDGRKLVTAAGAMFSGWQGSLLVGGMANESLMRIEIAGGRVNGVEKIDIGRRIRHVLAADDGSIWMVTEHEDGELVRLSAQ